MSEDNYVHQDVQQENTPAEQSFYYDHQTMKKRLLQRTVGTGLVTAMVTFVLTAALMIAAFYSVYAPVIEAQNSTAISFNNAKDTQTAVTKLKLMIQKIRENYVTKLTDAQIVEAMADGMPSSLGNPYTYYLSAEDYSSTKENMSGEYVGIGCTVTLTEDGYTEVVEVIAGGPAALSGLKTGDTIQSIDGKEIKLKEDPSTVASYVKGKEGTAVTIKVYRKSTNSSMSFSITRKKIQSQNVKHRMLSKTIGYVSVKGFVDGVETDFIAAMDDLQAQGAKNIVFDLRYNSGGSAQVMIEMLNYLLPKNTLMASIKGRQDGKDFDIKWVTDKDMKVPETMKYAILVNNYTASASEFFSGCLRDYGKATLIGEKTFGKGSGTQLFELPDGSAVNITMFKYYLPKGECIEGVGLTPDIILQLPEEVRYTAIESLTAEQDTQLQKAMEEFNKTK